MWRKQCSALFSFMLWPQENQELGSYWHYAVLPAAHSCVGEDERMWHSSSLSAELNIYSYTGFMMFIFLQNPKLYGAELLTFDAITSPSIIDFSQRLWRFNPVSWLRALERNRGNILSIHCPQLKRWDPCFLDQERREGYAAGDRVANR